MSPDRTSDLRARDTSRMTNLWSSPEHVGEYLARADRLPFRADGERVLVDDVGTALPGRVLDLGCGDGRLTALMLASYPDSTAVATDMSPPMLDTARARFTGDARATVLSYDFRNALPFDEPFDAIVTSLAVHHVEDDRKRTLYAEIAAALRPGGVFCNLEIVASPTQVLHDRWRNEMGAHGEPAEHAPHDHGHDAVAARDDPADRLCALEPQLAWLREVGLIDVDCIWKWRSLALVRGMRPLI